MRFKVLRHGLASSLALAVAACGSPPQAVVPFGPAPTGNSAKGLAQRDLLYVSNANGTVSVYRYWQRTLVTVLTKFTTPKGECSDAAGNVYIADYGAKKLYEYAHGGTKPIKTIDDSPYRPEGCAVSPKNGDLAVANYGESDSWYYGTGNLAIYPHGGGSPIFYGNEDDHFTGCAYDDYGDLLAVSQNGYSGPWYYYAYFYYLPKKSSKLILMNLPGPSRSWYWRSVQGVAWDGEYWDVNSYSLYLYSINIKANYVGKIPLSTTYGGLAQVALYRKALKGRATQAAGATNNYNGKNAVDFWKYPVGGTPIDDLTKDLDAPVGVAISLRTSTP